jgi:Icc-related predicted phosphoesterase
MALSSREKMKILFTTDLHGKKRKYDAVLSLALKHRVSAVFNGADMLPRYYQISQGEFILDVLKPFFQRLSKSGIAHFGMLGNDDLVTFDNLFDQVCNEFPNVFNIAQKLVSWQGLEILGMNYVRDYNFKLKDRCRLDLPTDNPKDQLQDGNAFFSDKTGNMTEMEIDEYLKLLLALPSLEDILNSLPKPKDWKNTILVTHHPPKHTGLDLTDERVEVGSKAVLHFIEKYQPKLSLHGHIHGSYYMSGLSTTEIGKTVAVQSGQRFEQCRMALIDLENLHVEIFENY